MDKSNGRRFSLCRTIATLGISFILVFFIASGGGGSCFIHLPSMFITIGICFLLLLGTYGVEILKFIPDSLLTLFSTPAEPNARYAEIAVFGSRYVIAGGVICTLIGLIQMLRNLTSPEQIGAGMAVALLAPLYALFVSEFIFAFAYKAYSDETNESSGKPLPVRNALLPLIIGGLIIVIFFLFILRCPSRF